MVSILRSALEGSPWLGALDWALLTGRSWLGHSADLEPSHQRWLIAMISKTFDFETMQASWNGAVIARSEDIVTVEGNAYFPADSLDPAYIQASSHRSVCGWKGEAHYYDVIVEGTVNANAAWFYPEPKQAAEQIKGRVAFWKGVKVQ